jgi:DNA-directed RNA polymerase subunit M/transcription elongation factor TFIIS
MPLAPMIPETVADARRSFCPECYSIMLRDFSPSKAPAMHLMKCTDCGHTWHVFEWWKGIR